MTSGEQFKARAWKRSGIDYSMASAHWQYLRPSSSALATSLTVKDGKFANIHPNLTSNGAKALVPLDVLAQFERKHTPVSFKTPEQAKWACMQSAMLEICNQHCVSNRNENVTIKILTEKIESIRVWVEKSKAGLQTESSFKDESILEKLITILDYMRYQQEQVQNQPSASRSNLLDGMELASSCILYYCKARLMKYWKVFGDFGEHCIQKCQQTGSISEMEINQLKVGLRLDPLEIESGQASVRSFCLSLLQFIGSKEKHETQCLSLIQTIMDQRNFVLDDAERNFCVNMQKNLETVLTWRQKVHNAFPHQLDYLSTLNASLSGPEKVLATRLAAGNEILILRGLELKGCRSKIEILREICMEACRTKNVSVLFLEIHNVNLAARTTSTMTASTTSTEGSYTFAIVGSNCRTWMEKASTTGFISSTISGDRDLTQNKLLVRKLGTTLEMGLTGSRQLSNRPFNQRIRVERLFKRIESAADDLLQLLTTDSDSGQLSQERFQHEQDQSATLHGFALYCSSQIALSRRESSQVIKTFQIQERKIISLEGEFDSLSEITNHSIVSKSNSWNFERSTRLHPAKFLWLRTMETIDLKNDLEADLAQASFDAFTMFGAGSRLEIMKQFQIDGLANDLMSLPAPLQTCLDMNIEDELAEEVTQHAHGNDASIPDLDNHYVDRDSNEDVRDSGHNEHQQHMSQARNTWKRRLQTRSNFGNVNATLNVAHNTLEEYYNLCAKTGLLRQVQKELYESEIFWTFSVIIPPFFPVKGSQGVPIYVVLSQIPDISGEEHEYGFFSSCSCRICSGLGGKTRAKQFFGKTLVLKEIAETCPSIRFMLEIVLPQVEESDSSTDTDRLVPHVTINATFCSVECMDMNQCKELRIVSIAQYFPDHQALVPFQAKEVFSVLQLEKGSYEHILVRKATLKQARLKDKQSEQNVSTLQLHCLTCNQRLVKYQGRSCQHCHTVAKYLNLRDISGSRLPSIQLQVEEEQATVDDSDEMSGIGESASARPPETSDEDEWTGGEEEPGPERTQSNEEDSDTTEETFDPSKARESTGYVMHQTLSSNQGNKVDFSVDFHESEQMGEVLRSQERWIREGSKVFGVGEAFYEAPEDQKFEAPSNCCCCKQPFSGFDIKTRKAKVYLPMGHVLKINAEYWDCRCGNQNCFDGSSHELWFYSPTLGYGGFSNCMLMVYRHPFLDLLKK
jgi:hypothetical protein